MSRLVLAGLRKAYGGAAAVDGLDLDVPAGSRTAIVGPSGCGKTTLLRLIAGFEPPDAGRIALGGRTLAEGPEAVPAHRRDVGIVLQDGALFPHLGIADNVGFGLPRDPASMAASLRRRLSFRRSPGRGATTEDAAARRETIGGLMDLVGLPRALLERRPDQLSGGQQQRVALARALARSPKLMLLDEPFSALDAGLRIETREGVAALLAAKGITTILVTHDHAEALSFADQVAVMRDGRFRRVGSPRDVYLRPRRADVAAFLGDSILLAAGMAEGRAACALGRLPVDAPERRGAVRLMLRPEQLRLASAPGAGAAEGARGRVVATRFAGATTTVLVRLDDAPGLDPLALPVAPFAVPAPGDAVLLAVDGPAHVLDD